MIHETAVIAETAEVSPLAHIGAHVVIEDGVVISDYVTVFPGAYIGKQPKVAGIIANPPKKRGLTLIGPGAVIGANVVIYAGTCISKDCLIGDGATIREGCFIGERSIIGNNSTLQNDVTIGRRVRVVDLSHITARVEIGDDVFWSVGVLSMNDNSMGVGKSVLEPPIVENGAKIGGGALLLPGVRIGEEAIVGSGSVVTKHVIAGTKVMGVPAKTKYAEQNRLMGEFYPEALPPRPYDDKEFEG